MQQKRDNISNFVIRRLPRYYRFVSDLSAQGVQKISSQALAEKMGVTASQIRQDFNCFGGFGHQGYGYNVDQLKNEIEKILGINKLHRAIIVGVGNMGKAIVTQLEFEQMGFKLIGLFDTKAELIGTQVDDYTIRSAEDLSDFCTENEVETAFLCIPKDSVDSVIELLYKSGVRGYWNFSHYDLKMKYDDVVVENVHLRDSLMTLCYHLTNK